MKKITQSNRSEVNLLQVSNTTKTIFNTFLDQGNTIYTPTAPVTYGTWNGLFYIAVLMSIMLLT